MFVEMDAPLNIRPALRSELPRPLALYPHLNPADEFPPLEVAERRFVDLKVQRERDLGRAG
jgi:hypothetical protein